MCFDDVFYNGQSKSRSAGFSAAAFFGPVKSFKNPWQIGLIDANEQMHFITTYSPYYADELVHVGMEKFAPVDTRKNRKLQESGRDADRLVAWRTTGEYWNRQRTVVVTYNPITATKQRLSFEKKMLGIQEVLYDFQAKVNQHAAHWRNKEQILMRYHDACAQLHLAADFYTVEVYSYGKGLRLNFRKNHYRISRYIDRFGKNIIITDNADWTTDEIVNASLDRWTVEDGFRQSKNDDLVAMMPIRHWTDSKIRCHLFTCVVAMTYLRRIELRLAAAGIKRTAADVMEDMRKLHQALNMRKDARKLERCTETPSKTQAEVLSAFGHRVDASGVLHPVMP